MTKKLLAGAVAAAVVGMAPMTASAVNFKDVMSGDVDFSIGGYVKLSAMWSEFDRDGDFANGGSDLSTFYLPGRMLGSTVSGADGSDLQMTARESRINFKASKKMGDHSLTSYLEMDFMTTENGSGSGNEIISNSYAPRLRHAFFKYDNWLFGQTWSTYMDTSVLPESVDFLAASEGTVFIRQPQVRYTHGDLQIALENSESWGATGDRDDNDLPDLAVNYKFKADWGHVRLHGLLRELNTSDGAGLSDDSAVGWGLGVTSKIMIGKDDLKLSLYGGEGSARYTGLALNRDFTTNPSNNDVELSETIAGFIAYRHWWTDQWRSSLIYSYSDTDYHSTASMSLPTKSESIAVNLMYSPVKPVTLGIMYLHGEIEDNGLTGGSDLDNEIDRIQVSAKYAF